jgi:hypothetical protein
MAVRSGAYCRFMSEQSMVELAQRALHGWGIEDTVHTVGQFEPRGESGAAFTGGILGSTVGDALGGSVGSAIGIGAGMLGGRAAGQASSGLPARLLVAVSDTMVYGLDARTRHSDPDRLLFGLPRSAVTAKVHQRVNVRVLELIRDDTGARIELEGSRVPLTHSHDVIAALTA